jgi:hypothetical protein
MPIKIWLQERVRYKFNILGALPVIGKAKTIFRMAKLNRVGKPTVGLIKAMDGVASITSSINKVTGAPVAYARTFRIEQ